jgi:hypothetical protein
MRRPRELDDCLDERVAIHQMLERKSTHNLSSGSDEDRKAIYEEYSRKHVRYFLLEVRTLLTVIDDPEEEYLRIICRDATGKYCWKVKCTNDDPADEKSSYVKGIAPPLEASDGGEGANAPSMPLPPAPPPPPTMDPLLQLMSGTPPISVNPALGDEEEYSKFMTRVDELENKIANPKAEDGKVLHKRRVSTRHHMGRRHTENNRGELVASHQDSFSWRNSRRLLSQIGFMNVDSWGRLEILDGTKQLVSKIVALDDTPDKDQHVVWIVRAVNQTVNGKQQIRIIDYADFDELAADEEFQKCESTLNYNNFLARVGERIETKSHLKFMDYVDSESFEGEYMYHESEHEEILFKVPSLRMVSKKPSKPLPQTQVLNSSLNLGDDLVNGKKRETSTPVIVLWNDCYQQYKPDSLLWRSYGLTNAQLFIIVDPTEAESQSGERLFRVRVYIDPSSVALREARTLGPLLDGMVLSAKMLPLMVRQTAVNAAKTILDYDRMTLARMRMKEKNKATPASMPTSKTAHPFVKRQRILQHIYEDHASDIPASQFLGMMFRGSFKGRLHTTARQRGDPTEFFGEKLVSHEDKYDKLVH